MLYSLLDLLLKHINTHWGKHLFSIAQYAMVKAVIAFSLSLIISFIIAPKLIKYLRAKKLGQFVRELGPKSHYEKSGTPTMGGVLIFAPPTITAFLLLPFNNPLLWITIIAFLGFGFLGFMDDYLKLIKKNNNGLSAKAKFLGQIILSFILVFAIHQYISTDLFIPFKWAPLFDLGILFIPFGMFVIISWTNSINLTDGLDGLAGGLTAFLLITIGILCYSQGNAFMASYLKLPYVAGSVDIAIFIAATLGSLVVFLWYNFFPAQIFMGDTGSLALGGLVGVVSLILKKEILIAFAGLIFIIETLSVIIQVLYYKKTKKRFFKMAPLHHHYELSGVPETKIVIRFWIIAIFLSLLAFASVKMI